MASRLQHTGLQAAARDYRNKSFKALEFLLYLVFLNLKEEAIIVNKIPPQKPAMSLLPWSRRLYRPW
jgi:hypothetical protein